MKILIILYTLAGALLLTACEKAPTSKIENPMANYTEALDKAKKVEDLVLKAAEDQRKAIDEMTQ